jgi:hypothetical protein
MVVQGQSTEISRLEARNLRLWAGYDETRSYALSAILILSISHLTTTSIAYGLTAI